MLLDARKESIRDRWSWVTGSNVVVVATTDWVDVYLVYQLMGGSGS